MAKEIEKTPERVETDVQKSYEAAADMNERFLETALKVNETVTKGTFDVGQELTEFANTRLQHNLETLSRLMQTRSVEEAFELQFEYARTATEQYLKEADTLTKLARRVTQSTWQSVEQAKQALPAGGR
jgi:hypothetical protein